MNPSKIRERKCSTCKHYQPSPLWRKGWCRNPLLYDRNVNHLVEADSLACNRTFIDYWEPVVGPMAPTSGGAPTGPRAAGKPRIAPSIPMEMMDAQGRRVTRTGLTPAAGMSAIRREDAAGYPPEYAVAADLDASSEDFEAARTTLELAQVEAPGGNGATGPQRTAGATRTAPRKARVARPPQPPIFLGMGRDRLLLIGATIAVVIAIAISGFWLVNRGPAVQPIPDATATIAPLPTPTGFGDPTATAPPAPTVTPVPPPPTDRIAVGGWVQVTSNLTLRNEPSRSGARLGVLSQGTKAHVIEGPREADGFTWWKVDQYDAGKPDASGWCAGEFLAPIPPP